VGDDDMLQILMPVEEIDEVRDEQTRGRAVSAPPSECEEGCREHHADQARLAFTLRQNAQLSKSL